MMAHGLVLRVRKLAAKLPRFSGALRVVLLLIALAWLLSASLAPSLADPPPPPPHPNQAPVVYLYSTFLGGGIWRLSGYVIDDQDSEGLMVDIWGPALAADDVAEVTDNNDFALCTFIVGPGAVYARVRDRLGALSNTATTYVGY